MKMRLTTVLAAVTAACALNLQAAEDPGAAAPKVKAPAVQSVYVCPDCHVLAGKAGKCEKCEKDLVQKHLLGVKDGKATICDCPADCKCDAKGVTDGKCACGKEVKTVDCKGLHCCAMGCELSKTPGKCAKCGMAMKVCE